jgi:hypothetical protein
MLLPLYSYDVRAGSNRRAVIPCVAANRKAASLSISDCDIKNDIANISSFSRSLEAGYVRFFNLRELPTDAADRIRRECSKRQQEQGK